MHIYIYIYAYIIYVCVCVYVCGWAPYSSAHHDRAPNQKPHLELLRIRICITKVDEYIKTK